MNTTAARVDLTKSPYRVLAGLVARLPAYQRRDVDQLHGQAIAYVWGWQDAGGAPKDTQVSTEFGYAYGIHAARFAVGVVSFRPSIQDAYQRWIQTGNVERERYPNT
jgi:hypothetical protein